MRAMSWRRQAALWVVLGKCRQYLTWGSICLANACKKTVFGEDLLYEQWHDLSDPTESRSCANGVHREMKIRTQYSFATKLATSNFIDQEITSWIEGLRPRGTPVQIDLRSLNDRTPTNRKLKQKVDKMAEEINRRMDSNSLTQAKVSQLTYAMNANQFQKQSRLKSGFWKIGISGWSGLS